MKWVLEFMKKSFDTNIKNIQTRKVKQRESRINNTENIFPLHICFSVKL